MDKYEALIEKMKTSGEVPEWVLDEVQTTYEASGLRTDLRDLKTKYDAALSDNTNLRTGLLADRFKAMGITIPVKVLQIPSDLAVTDEDKVREWAETSGLIAKTETTDPVERATHDRIAEASNEGGNSSIPTSADLDPRKMPEDDFYAQARLIEAKRK